MQTKRIRGRALQARRDRKRAEQPLCVRCLERGIVRAWTQLDHIVALTNDGEDTDENTQGLCDECHEAKTREDLGQQAKQRIGADGWPA